MFSWSPRRFAALSISAALLTMAIKFAAYLLTGSVGLLSDAAESVVNLAAALIAFWALGIAARPPDEEHAYGHTKAEYFSSGAEGALILLAAATIIYAAVPRLIHPQPIERPGIGLALAVVSAAINGGVGWVLLPAGRRLRSISLEADARHLFTDVWTTAGGDRRRSSSSSSLASSGSTRSSRCSSPPISSGPACGYCARLALDCWILRFPLPIRRASQRAGALP